MTDKGFETPPDHIVSQILSTFDLSSPVIIDISLFNIQRMAGRYFRLLNRNITELVAEAFNSDREFLRIKAALMRINARNIPNNSLLSYLLTDRCNTSRNDYRVNGNHIPDDSRS